MEIKFTKNTGNFSYAITANLNVETEDKLALYLLENGIVRELQGGILGAWEKSLAYPGKGVKRPEKNEAGEKWSRFDIAYNEENAEALRKALLGAEIKIGEDESEETIDLGIEAVEISEYTGAEKSEPKYKAEKDLLLTYLFEADGKTARNLKSGEPRTAESFAVSRGLTVPTEPWAEDTKFLAEVKAWSKAQAAAQD